MRTWLLLMGVAAAGTPEQNTAIWRALELPITAQHLREAGVADKDVADTLKAHQAAGLPAAEAEATAAEAEKNIKDHGPVDNFGAFVQARLAEGKRGQDLAAAIRAEHEARGKKHGVDHPPMGADGHGKSDEAHGKPSKDDGKPADASKDEHGKDDANKKPADADPPGERAKGAGDVKVTPGERGKGGGK